MKKYKFYTKWEGASRTLSLTCEIYPQNGYYLVIDEEDITHYLPMPITLITEIK